MGRVQSARGPTAPRCAAALAGCAAAAHPGGRLRGRPPAGWEASLVAGWSCPLRGALAGSEHAAAPGKLSLIHI
eukprot:6099813-Alexandrium_andersonii.AAC.1